jgi:hypothetical protein
MYTFHPLADIPVDHVGMFMVCLVTAFVLIYCLLSEPEVFFFWFFCATILVGISYGVSYHWTSQEPQTFKNETVTAEFAGYQPEGYREKSGKSMVDRHYMYVVYTVNGNPVILQAQTGQVYPKTVVLYKN